MGSGDGEQEVRSTSSTDLAFELFLDYLELANRLDSSLADVVLLGQLANGSLALAQIAKDVVLQRVGQRWGRSE